MATIQQIPATVDVQLVKGDEFSWPLVFSADLTDYTLTSGIYNAGLNTGTSVVTPTFTATVDDTDPEDVTTTVLVSVVETQTSSLTAGGNYRWWLRWVSPGGVTRTVVSGQFRVQNP